MTESHGDDGTMSQPGRGSGHLKHDLAGGGVAHAGEHPYVLVVDDDPDMTRLVTAALGTRGISCIAAYDSVQGFMLTQRRHPKLIIVDWHMPGGGGHGLLSQLDQSSHTRAIPVLVVTNDTSPEVDAVAQQHGARAVLRKPINPMEFLDLISALVK